MDNKQTCRHQDYLQKKESKGKWVLYWVVFDGRYLLFYESKTNQQIFGSIEIGTNTKCIVTQRKVNSFPFMVCALHGRYLFKCNSSIERHQWMMVIQRAAKSLKTSSSVVIETNKPSDDVTILQDLEETNNDDNDVLPPNVVLVTSFPATSDSPTHPFRIQDPSQSEVNAEKDKYCSPKSSTVLYPFARKSEDLSQKVCSSEKNELNSLNLRCSSASILDTKRLSRDDPDLPRNRSFPSTPEKGCSSRLASPSNTASCQKSRSLNSLSSSDGLLASNMKFSRHMSSEIADVEL